MALLLCHFFSEALGLSTSAMVILPQATGEAQVGMRGTSARGAFPALYLLHGWSDDETTWCRRTAIERHASELGLAVIMPRVDLSYYQDTPDGRNYWTYLCEELPALCELWFPLRTDREGRFAAGLSMGGYGAFRLGLLKSERYSAVGSLSGALDVAALAHSWREDPARSKLLAGIFDGSTTDVPEDADLLALLKRPQSYPVRFFQWCGTEDFLHEPNVTFREAALTAKLDLTYSEGPGDHSWEHWDREIQAFLAWL